MLPRWVDPLAWDATGALYALWTDSAGVWVGRSTDRATTWTTWRICAQDAAAPSYYPYLAARGHGQLAATWMIGVADTIHWRAARIRVGDDRRPPEVEMSTPAAVEGWTGDPPRANAGGEYFATAVLRDGSIGVVTPIQHESAGRLGFAWSRFRADSARLSRGAVPSCGRAE